MITETKKFIHWNYFLSIENDVENLARYVEFTKENFRTYSIEMVRLLLSASSEVDVVAKLLCKKINTESKADKINQYREIINETLPSIKSMKIILPKYGLKLTPWSNWKNDETPIWWIKHIAVKHQRDTNFKEANLKNVLNCVGALYVLLLYYYYEELIVGSLYPRSQLFDFEEVLIYGL